MYPMYVRAENAADISDAADTTQYTIYAPFKGVIRLDECFLRWTEATGTQTTTAGVISISVAGTEVATLTAGVSLAIGKTQRFTSTTPTTNPKDPYIEFAADDAIVIKTKTQAVDGTITGDGDVFLHLELGI